MKKKEEVKFSKLNKFLMILGALALALFTYIVVMM